MDAKALKALQKELADTAKRNNAEMERNIKQREENDALIEKLKEPYRRQEQLAQEWNILRGNNQQEIADIKARLRKLVADIIDPAITQLRFDEKNARTAASSKYDYQTHQRLTEAHILALQDRAERMRLAINAIEQLPFTSTDVAGDLNNILANLRAAEFTAITSATPAPAKRRRPVETNPDIGERCTEEDGVLLIGEGKPQRAESPITII